MTTTFSDTLLSWCSSHSQTEYERRTILLVAFRNIECLGKNSQETENVVAHPMYIASRDPHTERQIEAEETYVAGETRNGRSIGMRGSKGWQDFNS